MSESWEESIHNFEGATSKTRESGKVWNVVLMKEDDDDDSGICQSYQKDIIEFSPEK